MTESEITIFNEAWDTYAAGNRAEALRKIEELAQTLRDPADKAGLLYHEVIWLLELAKISEARKRLKELLETVASLGDPPADSGLVGPSVSLTVMALFADARVVMEEGDEAAAQEKFAILAAKYPKQLSQFPDLCGEVSLFQGIFPGNADRWSEAKLFLENASPPDDRRGLQLYYLGHCYYALGQYPAARIKLLEAIRAENLEPIWIARSHYILGLCEYHLSNVAEAKRHFEQCVKIADPEYLGTTKVWEWLEATSQTLGLKAEAAEYRRRRTYPPNSPLM